MPIVLSVTRLLRIVFTLLAVSAAKPVVAEEWTSLRTPHFELLTTNSQADAQQTLQLLETTRAFFQQTTSLIPAGGKPVRIFAFRSREEYAPFRLQKTSFAHYLHSRRGDYIVLQDISPEHHRAAIHEYTHYVFRMAGLNLPIWLCEGTADLYSSLMIEGRTATLGSVLPSRYQSITQQALLPLSDLFAVDHASPLYNDAAKLPLFYGESWSLVHMLAFDKQYRAGFPAFLQAVSAGRSSAEALQETYHKTVSDVAADLRGYLPRLAENQTEQVLEPMQTAEPTVAAMTSFESNLAMADLLAAHRLTAGQARNRLEALQRSDRSNPQAEEILSYLAAQDAGTRTASR